MVNASDHADEEPNFELIREDCLPGLQSRCHQDGEKALREPKISVSTSEFAIGRCRFRWAADTNNARY